MPKVTFIDAKDASRTINIPVGWSLMEGAVQNDVAGILAECGGGCACATCHVIVAPEWAERLPARSPAENDLLECTAVARTATSRLSCQIPISEALDGLVVRLPERQT
ncbi:MAG TPA: 2Fe-2S iron-sulfur cluster-binding protein [Gammaproteobacteria bacterium]|nr:2Fe-2S iron-sulfur cluster-binding protein [Gammaproteobacteria bacterium]